MALSTIACVAIIAALYKAASTATPAQQQIYDILSSLLMIVAFLTEIWFLSKWTKVAKMVDNPDAPLKSPGLKEPKFKTFWRTPDE